MEVRRLRTTSKGVRATTTHSRVDGALGSWPGAPRVVVVARNPTIRAELRSMLDGSCGIRVVEEAGNVDEVRVQAGEAEVFVVATGGKPGDAAAVLGRRRAGVGVVLVADSAAEFRGATRTQPQVARAYLAGETTAEDLTAAVRAVVRGFVVVDAEVAAVLDAGPGARWADGTSAEELTPRELDVVRAMALGLPNKGIAKRLGISEHTVKFHVGAILGKLEAGSRTEAVMVAARNGWLAL